MSSTNPLYTKAHQIRIRPPASTLRAEIALPGSKSYTNRALMVAAIAGGHSVLGNPSPSDDSRAMKDALMKLGVSLEDQGSQWIVRRTSQDFVPFKGTIDVGPAGTTMRFLTSLIASIPGAQVELRGSERMHQRPIDKLVGCLRACGAVIEYKNTDGCPPLFISGRQLRAPDSLTIDGSVSSQFISSLLLVSPRIQNFNLMITGKLVSRSYIEMALDTIRQFAGEINHSINCTEFSSSGTPYRSGTFEIEIDASGASYFWGLAAISGGEVTVKGTNLKSVQGDMVFPDLLEQMGCEITRGERQITVRGGSQLARIEANMDLCPDTAQTLAVLAACAQGSSVISGLSTLRVKETDRLAALKNELESCGINSTVTEESIIIRGGHPHYAAIRTYEDHRMAFSFSLLGARADGITIIEPGVVTKSLPNYWEMIQSMGLQITEEP